MAEQAPVPFCTAGHLGSFQILPLELCSAQFMSSLHAQVYRSYCCNPHEFQFYYRSGCSPKGVASIPHLYWLPSHCRFSAFDVKVFNCWLSDECTEVFICVSLLVSGGSLYPQGGIKKLGCLLVGAQVFSSSLHPGLPKSRTQQEADWLRSVASIVYRVPDTAPHNRIKMWACGLETMTNPQTAGSWARGCLEGGPPGSLDLPLLQRAFTGREVKLA